MAIVNLEGLTHPDDIALAWARFLVEDLVERREAKTQAIHNAIFVFELRQGIPQLPTLPELFDDESEPPHKIIEKFPDAYAYLAVLPGIPIPPSNWESSTGLPAKRQLLGIPMEMIEPGDYVWYIMGIFHSKRQQMVFCGGFDGEKFSQVKTKYGSYGGVLSDLFRMDA
jgi:hypothetical protein